MNVDDAGTQAADQAFDLVIRAQRAVLPEGVSAAEVGVREGAIVEIATEGAGLSGSTSANARVVELDDSQVLLPGLVDSHVHVNDPGRSEWEGFASATRAAAAGGVTTIVDMPLNSLPPTVNVESLGIKRQVAASKAFIDVGFWGGAIPGNTGDLKPLFDAGVYGFKCFLEDSGVDEFPPLEPEELCADLAELAKYDGLLIVHAEDHSVMADAPKNSGRKFSDFLASRPREAENVAIARVIDAARETGARAHILHLSSADALPQIAEAKAEGVKLTVETCPHYLVFTAEEIPDGATTHKCCPPIREESNREALWQGLVDGTIDCIVSDHSPSTAELKLLDTGDFGAAWGGISSLQLGLSLVWTEAAKRGIDLAEVVAWMSSAPASVAGVKNKGAIALGNDADFAVFAPDEEWTVHAAELYHRNQISAYDTRAVRGAVKQTILRGAPVDFDEPQGRLLRAR
ncbi:allantoinase AllB [Brevibacterium aurantiacum]|uniref:allantoinase n=1 Tax=Brevibacterium aurantiacum TaxID=273384 RepID=A0A556CI00_BREAU|nr:allantoinase AllB [Brevibacterium aurantiacum]TSI16936.1 allantoinase AllB [Brevibacterium aurantiacum]